MPRASAAGANLCIYAQNQGVILLAIETLSIQAGGGGPETEHWKNNL